MHSDTQTRLDWNRVIAKGAYVARNISREYPGIEASDIEQEIFLYIAENRNSIERTTEHLEAGLEAIMYRAGKAYAAAERIAYIYSSCEWLYTPKETRGLLSEAFFDPALWENMPCKDDGVKISAKGVVISLWDIRSALESLEAEDQELVRRRYQLGLAFEDEAEKRRLYRAIDKITQRMNTGVARRRSVDTDTI